MGLVCRQTRHVLIGTCRPNAGTRRVGDGIGHDQAWRAMKKEEGHRRCGRHPLPFLPLPTQGIRLRSSRHGDQETWPRARENWRLGFFCLHVPLALSRISRLFSHARIHARIHSLTHPVINGRSRSQLEAPCWCDGVSSTCSWLCRARTKLARKGGVGGPEHRRRTEWSPRCPWQGLKPCRFSQKIEDSVVVMLAWFVCSLLRRSFPICYHHVFCGVWHGQQQCERDRTQPRKNIRLSRSEPQATVAQSGSQYRAQRPADPHQVDCETLQSIDDGDRGVRRPVCGLMAGCWDGGLSEKESIRQLDCLQCQSCGRNMAQRVDKVFRAAIALGHQSRYLKR